MIDSLNKTDCMYCNKRADYYRIVTFLFYVRIEHYCEEHMALIKREKHLNLTLKTAKKIKLQGIFK